ncbi:MAG: nuclear transport factor 2 family protein [Saprospiraceae bacterium]
MSQPLIEKFYSSFASGDAEGMIACYHDEVTFSDPAFGTLHGDRAKAMWRMLLGSGADSTVHYFDIESTGDTGKASWIAKYFYGPKRRLVVNEVSAAFTFKDGKIYTHADDFDLWRWTRQAIGLAGTFMGWSGFMRNKIQATTKGKLDAFIAKG